MNSLHITNGSCAAELVKQAFKLSKNELLTINDLLCCGLIGDINKVKTWISDRESYWHNILTLTGNDVFPMSNFPRDFYFNYSDINEAKQVNIWLGTSLGDQMMLAFVVAFFKAHSFDLSKINIYQFEKHCSKNFSIAGLAMLSPSELLEQLKTVQPFNLSGSMVEYLTNGWQALTEKTPSKLLTFLTIKNTKLTLFSQALNRLIKRFPDYKTGLSIWEQRILNAALGQEQKATKIIGQLLSIPDELDLVGDLYLFALIKKLASNQLNKPLLQLNNNHSAMTETKVSITHFGKAVLAGKSNHVKTNGINRFIAGIHLSSNNQKVWYRKGDKVFYYLSQ